MAQRLGGVIPALVAVLVAAGRLLQLIADIHLALVCAAALRGELPDVVLQSLVVAPAVVLVQLIAVRKGELIRRGGVLAKLILLACALAKFRCLHLFAHVWNAFRLQLELEAARRVAWLVGCVDQFRVLGRLLLPIALRLESEGGLPLGLLGRTALCAWVVDDGVVLGHHNLLDQLRSLVELLHGQVLQILQDVRPRTKLRHEAGPGNRQHGALRRSAEYAELTRYASEELLFPEAFPVAQHLYLP